MIRPTKSPNMMSTTGRSPVIAAPTPIPVKPASEIGVSSTRSGPNSCTNPESTLKAVPASATSSPITNTRGSRRNSSASASRTASPKVNSRTATAASGIYVLLHFVYSRVGRRDRELDRLIHFRFHFRFHLVQTRAIGQLLRGHPIGEKPDRIALAPPLLLLLLG